MLHNIRLSPSFPPSLPSCWCSAAAGWAIGLVLVLATVVPVARASLGASHHGSGSVHSSPFQQHHERQRECCSAFEVVDLCVVAFHWRWMKASKYLLCSLKKKKSILLNARASSQAGALLLYLERNKVVLAQLHTIGSEECDWPQKGPLFGLSHWDLLLGLGHAVGALGAARAGSAWPHAVWVLKPHLKLRIALGLKLALPFQLLPHVPQVQNVTLHPGATACFRLTLGDCY